jgi:hypothetical protein
VKQSAIGNDIPVPEAIRSYRAGIEEDDSLSRDLKAKLMRTLDGVEADALPADDPALEGLVEWRGDRVVLSVEGRLLANEVALRLR